MSHSKPASSTSAVQTPASIKFAASGLGHAEIGYVELIEAARYPDRVATLAFAGLIALAPHRPPPYDVPIAALPPADLAAIRERYFPDLLGAFDRVGDAGAHYISDDSAPQPIDEFDDLVDLLLDHRTVVDQESTWLAYAIATACMGSNHLWQDMGLPNRAALSELIGRYFSSLATANHGDMKWKKFFYRQLCKRAGLTLCRSPSCQSCSDFQNCFGPEDAVDEVAPRTMRIA